MRALIKSWRFWDAYLVVCWIQFLGLIVLAMIAMQLQLSPERWTWLMSIFPLLSTARLLATRPTIGTYWPLYMLLGQFLVFAHYGITTATLHPHLWYGTLVSLAFWPLSVLILHGRLTKLERIKGRTLYYSSSSSSSCLCFAAASANESAA